ncbi:hypothetical protein C7C46_31490 [Streptomyces tateyamensis]|uniref:ABC3 transporter permease C-terminal domain-containing protein n=1 Tax=Streptomyces tateyamensis TaxID=565073 RepID=A0A2V4N043_9ACTN|nr:hypothetical protein C7C46_31490 [Streptomyces tateyamensis]
MPTAFGTRRRTLAAALLCQCVLPVLLGLALALAFGTGLATGLLSLTSLPLALPWAQIGLLCAAGAAAVLLVTALSLPALWRAGAVRGLRHE